MSTIKDYGGEEWKAIGRSGSSWPVDHAVGRERSGGHRERSDGRRQGNLAVSGRRCVRAREGNCRKREARRWTSGAADVPTGDRAKATEALLGVIRNAVAVVQAKSPAEVQGYKTWLASVATKVSQASKEGGFLGIGGTLVSREEQDALKQLADVLGVSPS